MTVVKARCLSCGYKFTSSNLINVDATSRITISNVTTSCPRCGKTAKTQDGVYGAIGRILDVVTAPGTSKGDLLAFQDISKRAATGAITHHEGERLSAEIGSKFEELWSYLNTNGQSYSLIVTIISAVLALYAIHSSNQSSDQQHQDALEQQTMTHIETKAVETLTAVQQKLYEIVQQQSKTGLSRATSSPPSQTRPLLNRPQMQTPASGGGNRAERRKAARLAKKPQHGKNTITLIS